VVFLSNLFHWLHEQGTAVSLKNCNPARNAIKYLAGIMQRKLADVA
jgi:hypothetical protein